MEWKILDKDSLEKLKETGSCFIGYVKDCPSEVAFGYKIALLMRVHIELNKKFPLYIKGDYWFSILYSLKGELREPLCDDEMLEFFSHYMIIESPNP